MSITRFHSSEERGGSVFAVSSTATVVGGIAIAGMALYWLRPAPPPPPALPPPEPEVRIVKERVEVKAPPEIHIVEKRIEVPAPPPAKLVVEIPDPWNGVWKLPNRSLPVFQIRRTGETFSGICAPNWTGTYPFSGGRLRDGMLEFAVTDNQLCRLHFRMEMSSDGQARVESWMKPEDALVMLSMAVKLPKTPQQAYWLRLNLEKEIKRLGRPLFLGTFRRVVDPGKQVADSTKTAGRGRTPGRGP